MFLLFKRLNCQFYFLEFNYQYLDPGVQMTGYIISVLTLGTLYYFTSVFMRVKFGFPNTNRYPEMSI